MMKACIAGLIFLAAALPLAADTTTAPPAAKVFELANVNGEPLTSDQLISAFANRHSGHAKFLGGDHEARKFLEVLVNERLFIQEGFNIGLDEEPDIKKQVDQLEAEKMTGALIAQEIDGKTKPTPDEVKAAWAKLDIVIQAREIAVATKAEAEEIRNAILHGANFDALVRSCSRVESGKSGGNILVNWGQRDPAFEEAVFALDAGELSKVIETPDWYEIVIVDARHDVEKPEFKKVEEEISSVLQSRKLEQRKREYSNELFAKYHVQLQPLPSDPVELLRLIRTAPDTVVATWDGGNMTLKDAIAVTEVQPLLKATPLRAKTEIDQRVRSTVNEPIVLLEAKARKFDEQPEVATAVKRYRELMVQDALFREHIWAEVKVTEEDVTKYYEAHKADFIAPEKRHVAHIMLSNEAEAKKVSEKITAGADFDQLVAKYSRDFVTARSGGDLGWITPDKVSDSFQQVLKLPVGGISKPMQSAAGWHIVKIIEITPKRQLGLAEVHDQARQKTLDQKQREAQKYWLDKLKSAASIRINDEAIREFVKENAYNGAPPPQHGPK